MKPFSKNELIAVSIILSIIFVVTFSNLLVALRRSRDAQRRSDLGAISNALIKYNQEFGFFPPDENGKIKACKSDKFDEVIEQFKNDKFNQATFTQQALTACEWGEDQLTDLGLFSEETSAYLTLIPQDPKEEENISYLYISNTRRFQIYSYLEGEESEEGYDLGIVERNLYCGNKICSFGKTYADTPLDRSIEEYEQELLELQKTRLK